MIRTLLIAAAFLTITVGLIVLQPGRGPGSPAETPTVTRAETDLTTIATTEPRVQPAPIQVAPAKPAPVAQITTDNSDLGAMTSGVLAELGLQTSAPTPAPETAALRDMTAGVLSNIRTVTGKTEAHAAPAGGLQTLVAQALREGKSDDYIDALLNEAAQKGEVTVPKALVTSEGRVDTSTLLANIVAQAKGATDQEQVQPITGGEGVEVRVVQKADGETVQYKFYTVGRGDSLGSIAVKFYGDASRFTAIFEANRGQVSSPDRIRAGQRLVIPTI